MKNFIVLLASIFLIQFAYANVCEVPKSKLVISHLQLGASALDLVKKYEGLSLKDSQNKPSDKFHQIGMADELDPYLLQGQPITGINYIEYLKKNYEITSFGVGLEFDDFDIAKVKEVITLLYGLPKKGWTVHKDEDMRYGMITDYNYKCDDYSIVLHRSDLGTTMRFYGKIYKLKDK